MNREEQFQEAGALLRSARAWLEELGEEGVTSFEPLAPNAPAEVDAALQPASRETERRPAEPSQMAAEPAAAVQMPAARRLEPW